MQGLLLFTDYKQGTIYLTDKEIDYFTLFIKRGV